MTMHIERVLELINLIDVPEKKRKFWPQYSVIVLDQHGSIHDVVQRFGDDPIAIVRETHRFYPEATMIVAQPGWYQTSTELKQRITESLSESTEDTYVVGKGLVRNMANKERKERSKEEDGKKESRWQFWK